MSATRQNQRVGRDPAIGARSSGCRRGDGTGAGITGGAAGGGRRLRLGLRAARQVLVDEKDEKQGENGIDAEEAEESEEGVAGGYLGGSAARRAQEAVDQPGLAPRLGGDPAGGVGDVGEGEGEH